jgi:hypothetical protein
MGYMLCMPFILLYLYCKKTRRKSEYLTVYYNFLIFSRCFYWFVKLASTLLKNIGKY